MGPPKLSNAHVALETSLTPDATKVVLVSWELTDSAQTIDGEWKVEWDAQYPAAPPSPEPEAYIPSPEPEPAPAPAPAPAALRLPHLQRLQAPDEDHGPLSTARLLEFENGGLEENLFPEPAEDLPAFFGARPLVQAPVEIVARPAAALSKVEVMFLLAADYPVPAELRVVFTEAWTPAGTPPALVATLQVPKEAQGQVLHTAWATKRLEDLKALQEILAELEKEGQRGLGQGRIKVGVKGGGMDEEAVRREGWMVGEETAWVHERFLAASLPAEDSELLDPMAGLGISTGLHFARGPTLSTVFRSPKPEQEEEEEDFFALPLSPRSPDMTVSPFSFR